MAAILLGSTIAVYLGTPPGRRLGLLGVIGVIIGMTWYAVRTICTVVIQARTRADTTGEAVCQHAADIEEQRARDAAAAFQLGVEVGAGRRPDLQESEGSVVLLPTDRTRSRDAGAAGM